MSTTTSESDVTAGTRRALEVIYGAAARGDLEAFIGAMHPEVEIHEPGWLPYGGVYRGIEGLGELLPAATAVLDLSTLAVRTMIVEGEHGFVEVEIKTSDGTATAIVGEHWTIRDGKPWHCRVYHFDTAPLQNLLAATGGD
jgi:hypothetical protein